MLHRRLAPAAGGWGRLSLTVSTGQPVAAAARRGGSVALSLAFWGSLTVQTHAPSPGERADEARAAYRAGEVLTQGEWELIKQCEC